MNARDVGTPTGGCVEGSVPGTFSRHYTRGVAQLDCNTFEASLEF